ncbi:chemotaxis protein methyltransferase CheR [Kineococcus radiotolerans]|uniref:protein-glutamate O-methyltransferase n=1 Tax=Kineococcus radiotolerans TaxID=131568 RepID=A0A7W4TJQ3_KINRA|nr:protein-glutamate O-methyltransferase CheR [Kineococcus radiotolerans]MBB2899546.1 chemotaxis protein methyltransferase CheR [Kineococcus radiotolerans]
MSLPTTAAAGQLTDAQFGRVREWIYRRTGIQFGDNKRYFVDKRVATCVREHGGDFNLWFASLRAGANDRVAQQLVNELTVNETYFLREDHQFDSLVRSVLPGIAEARRTRRDRSPIRILSVPCSTGEEPYSIAIRLLSDWPGIEEFDVEIVAADIDTRVLDLARRGEYGSRSMHRVPPAVRAEFFERAEGDRHRVREDVRGAIDFTLANLTDTAQMRTFRAFDVVFCRNVLIYFDELSSRRAAENLFGALRPGGFLFLGHSESMSRISPIFDPVRLPEGIAYQRPAIGAPA